MSDATDRPFTGVCPFCGTYAELPIDRKVISRARRCPCGAIALGAPRWDFDEVIDDALNYYGVRATARQKNFEPPERWLADAGVALVEGGLERDGHFPYQHYWFRRTPNP